MAMSFHYQRKLLTLYRRVLKINGDQSGKFLVDHLIAYAKQQGHITFVEDISIDHIIQKENQCHGIMGHIHKNGAAR